MISKATALAVCLALLFSTCVYCQSSEVFYLKVRGTNNYLGLSSKKIAPQMVFVTGAKSDTDESQLFEYDSNLGQFRFHKNKAFVLDYAIANGSAKTLEYTDSERVWDLPRYLGGKAKVQWKFNDKMNIINRAEETVGLKVNAPVSEGSLVVLSRTDLAVWEKEPFDPNAASACSAKPTETVAPDNSNENPVILPSSTPQDEAKAKEFVLDTSVPYIIFMKDYYLKHQGNKVVKVKDAKEATKFKLRKFKDGLYKIEDGDRSLSRCYKCRENPNNNEEQSVTFHMPSGDNFEGWTLWKIPGAIDPPTGSPSGRKCSESVREDGTNDVQRSPPILVKDNDTGADLEWKSGVLAFEDKGRGQKGDYITLVPYFE